MTLEPYILSEIIPAVTAVIIALIPFYFEKLKNKKKDQQIAQLKEDKKNSELRITIVDKILDISLLGKIQDAVKNMFDETKADRFLILVAVNGKVNFNVVSVIYEQHKDSEYRGNAIARYRNLEIDEDYRNMLKEAEAKGYVEIDTQTMPDSLLKSIYKVEGVNHSKIRHLLRLPIDEGNDILVFSSVATHEEDSFEDFEKMIFMTQYNSTIIPSLKQIISEF